MSGPTILAGLRGVDQARENDWSKLVRSDIGITGYPYPDCPFRAGS
jgi:hypothetical protein